MIRQLKIEGVDFKQSSSEQLPCRIYDKKFNKLLIGATDDNIIMLTKGFILDQINESEDVRYNSKNANPNEKILRIETPTHIIYVVMTK